MRDTANPTVEIIDVTPELAVLARPKSEQPEHAQGRDRRLRPRHGFWRLGPERRAVKFDVAGRLIDGWHRHSAVIASETPVAMIVVRGVDASVMDTVDAGAQRAYADVLKHQGQENTSTLAAVVRRAGIWERGARTNTGSVKPTLAR